jgi:riboflavin biosynthesis pyrimidine reductase
LLKTGQVDELQLYVNPSIVGGGYSIFDEPRRMQLIDATPFGCGIIIQRYRPGATLNDTR